MREKILNYQRDFYKNARNSVENGAYVFGSEKDASSAYELAKILEKHKIEIHKIKENFESDGMNFKKNSAYVVPKNQRQHRLVKAMFERRTEFEDSLFYDISAWTLPLAFNLDYAEDVKMNKAGEKIKNLEKPEIDQVEISNYAYVMHWHDFYSPKALNMILEKGLRAKVGMQPFSLENKEYDYGTILIPVQNQELEADKMHQFLQEVSQKSNVQIEGINTGLTHGVNLGSNQFRALQPAKVALIVGEGITPYDAGEIWHLFDQRYDMKITKLDTRNFSRADLSRYTDIILPNSWGSALDDSDIDKLKEWVRDGGTLIGYRNAARFFEKEDFMDLEIKKDSLVAENISFEEQRDFRGAQGIGGAIFEANIDRSHPVNFGYTNDKLPLFRNTTIFVEADKQSYNNPIQYTEEPLLSGYISAPRLDSIAGTVPFKHTGMGSGNVILFTDNTNFRAFWFGTNKLLMNAIFFGDEM